tara:strand:- start:420 stop:1334 length:915 start_codon:yes stop_codon:yes gene_type:complete
MNHQESASERLARVLPMLRCPQTGSPLTLADQELHARDSSISYPCNDGIPDLRRAPDELNIRGPWYEPWDDLETVLLAEPEVTVETSNLPHHLDKYLASVAGNEGDGKSILEVGCGDRQCESWFSKRQFNYIGTDMEVRGPGPHVLADAHNLPFADESFDFYTSMAVYEHLVSPLTAAQEAFRVLKPGGVFFGSSAFVYCFHDHASFHHMSHAGLFYILRVVGFEVDRLWPDWDYQDAIPEMGFRGRIAAPWRMLIRGTLKFSEWSFVKTSNFARRIVGKPPINEFERRLHTAGSISFVARRPG